MRFNGSETFRNLTAPLSRRKKVGFTNVYVPGAASFYNRCTTRKRLLSESTVLGGCQCRHPDIRGGTRFPMAWNKLLRFGLRFPKRFGCSLPLWRKRMITCHGEFTPVEYHHVGPFVDRKNEPSPSAFHCPLFRVAHGKTRFE